jgi:hypothetical protein
VIRGRVIMRARVPVNDGWWNEGIVPVMIQLGKEFSCRPEQSAELLPTHARCQTSNICYPLHRDQSIVENCISIFVK